MKYNKFLFLYFLFYLFNLFILYILFKDEIVKKIEMEDTSDTIHRKLNQKGFIVLKERLVNELFAPSQLSRCYCKICQE